MKRPLDVVEDQLKILVKDAATTENLVQRHHFTVVNSYLDRKMEDMIISKEKVG